MYSAVGKEENAGPSLPLCAEMFMFGIGVYSMLTSGFHSVGADEHSE